MTSDFDEMFTVFTWNYRQFLSRTGKLYPPKFFRKAFNKPPMYLC